MKRLITPLTGADVEDSRVGDRLLLSGKVYTARDAAHKRLVDLIEQNKPLPIDLEGQVILLCRAGSSLSPSGHRSCRADHQLPDGSLHAAAIGPGA